MAPLSHVFVDESRRKDSYYVMAATVLVAELGSTRKALRGLLGKGQAQLHFNNERDSRRRQILDVIGETSSTTRIYVAEERHDIEARYRCINRLVADMRKVNASRLVIEARESQDDRDRRWIAAARHEANLDFDYSHIQPRSEPLLWIPDAVGWAYGKGGPWRTHLLDLGLVEGPIQI